MASNHARRHSFERHQNVSFPVRSIEHLAEKRAALKHFLTRPPLHTSRCVSLPADTKCPRSFGNRYQNVLSALMTATVLRATVRVDVSALECHSLLRFKLRYLQTAGEDTTVVTLGHPTTCGPLSLSMRTPDASQCFQPPLAHGQLTAWCSIQRQASTPLFALGPHAAFGSIFDASFDVVSNKSVAALSPRAPDELLIAVHARHFDGTQRGDEAIEAFEAAIRQAKGEGARACAILIASDRRLALHMFRSVAVRVGCRYVSSARGPPIRDFKAEHGEDVGEVVLHDISLLGQADILVGTWGSTLTLLIQELIAARSDGRLQMPTVTFCETSLRRCMRPLPLLAAQPSDQWFVKMSPSGAMQIATDEALQHAKEWAEWGAQQQTSGPPIATQQLTVSATSPVSLVQQLSNRTQCKLGKTFGIQAGGLAMWASHGCRGRFRCGESTVVCGRFRSLRRHDCACQADDSYGTVRWPSISETVEKLDEVVTSRPFDLYGGRPPVVKWLAAIISGSSKSARFVAAANAATAAGGVVRHIPAAMPSHYRGRGDMVRDLFGVAKRNVMRLTAHEIGLLISHKRALKAIALSEFSWGAVLEDDAYLHEAVQPKWAGQLLTVAFAAADLSPKRPQPLLYLGCCNPRCEDGLEDDPKPAQLSSGLLRAGRCQAYCTHAYALTRSHASSFFADVFGCHRGSAACGRECEYRPCFMDWAMSRHFRNNGTAWIVGGGLEGKFVQNHRGLFIQNRSAALGNRVSGTSLGKHFRWTNDSAFVDEQRCERGFAVDSKRQEGGLQKVLISIRWSGRLGNLLFELAMLAGVVARLRTSVATVEAVTFGLPSALTVPVKELFDQFSLTGFVKVEQWEENGFDSAYSAELTACEACKLTVEERYANAYDKKLVEKLTSWVSSPPHGCTLGLIQLKGYFQSYMYFDPVAADLLRSTLLPAAAPMTAAKRHGNAFVARVRRALPVVVNGGHKLVGVQVRLGDKARSDYFSSIYAATSWDYYLAAMRDFGAKFLREGAASVAFIVTAGGSMENNTEDIADAQRHLGHGRVFFSTSTSPYVDLAILRQCDALVLGPSTFGWWAAWLANLPEGRIVAPRQLFNPKLPRSHTLVKGFHVAEYYPASWRLLGNDGIEANDRLGTTRSRSLYVAKNANSRPSPRSALTPRQQQDQQALQRARRKVTGSPLQRAFNTRRPPGAVGPPAVRRQTRNTRFVRRQPK